jgi:hypothetical protein
MFKITKPQLRSVNARRRRDRGFTLIEAALATVIVGTGVLSILAAQQAYHRKNGWANHAGTAMLLANEIRELTFGMPLHDPTTGATYLGPEPGEADVKDYDDIDDFAGVVSMGIGSGTTFSPPINALRQQIPDMEQWTQNVMVEGVDPDNISSSITRPLSSSNVVRVTVTVTFQATPESEPQKMGTLMWVVAQSQ